MKMDQFVNFKFITCALQNNATQNKTGLVKTTSYEVIYCFGNFSKVVLTKKNVSKFGIGMVHYAENIMGSN